MICHGLKLPFLQARSGIPKELCCAHCIGIISSTLKSIAISIQNRTLRPRFTPSRQKILSDS